ncbi:MAG: hypothetical protein HAW59_05825 [Betaproteobacteria bacterium]|nr:hypothetical protein [Betaproteobacteria bacterium]
MTAAVCDKRRRDAAGMHSHAGAWERESQKEFRRRRQFRPSTPSFPRRRDSKKNGGNFCGEL